VIVTVLTKDYLESTIVLGVNDHALTKDAFIVSNANCTTMCWAAKHNTDGLSFVILCGGIGGATYV
jgi:glyceraldehyde-3-phosphate dehydrogenase/erythrose-4-phosphate dehydrogenase